MSAILSRCGFDRAMLEVVLGGIILLVVLVEAFIAYRSRSELINAVAQEGELVKENLNHLAGAIISLSELLDDADEVIENISKVPTVGDIIQQALMGFITQKMQNVLPDPVIEPMQHIIKDKVVEVVHGEEKRPSEKENED